MGFNRKDYPLLAILLLIAAYLFIRMFSVAATFDEVWTIRDFVTLTLPDIISYSPTDANNHLLNTLMIKVAFQLNESLFMARLPALLGGLLYLIFAFLICRDFFKGLLKYAFILAITLNPFMLDFFSLARGYSVSLGCSLAMIWFLLHYHQHPEKWKLKYIMIFACLAVISNFTYLNFFFSMLVVLFYIHFIKKLPFKSLILHSAGALLILISIIAVPIYKLIKNNMLYYGGNEGIYRDSLHSLTRYTLYDRYDFENATIILNAFLILIGLIVVIQLYAFRRSKSIAQSKEAIILLLTALPMIANVLQHNLFGTNFLVERTALLYYPLLILFIFFWLRGLMGNFSQLASTVGSILALAILFNFMMNANLNKTATWYFEIHTHKILDYLHNQSADKAEKLILDAAWPFSNSISYYLPADSPEIVYKREFSYDNKVEGDYFLHYAMDMPEVGYISQEQTVLKLSHDTVLKFPEEGVYLLKLNVNNQNH